MAVSAGSPPPAVSSSSSTSTRRPRHMPFAASRATGRRAWAYSSAPPAFSGQEVGGRSFLGFLGFLGSFGFLRFLGGLSSFGFPGRSLI